MKKRVLSLFLAIVMVVGSIVCSPVASAVVIETEGNYTYMVLDGKATITAVDSAISGDVVIPATLGGYPVNAIAKGVFSGLDAITTISLSAGIISIGEQAFVDCTQLTAIWVNAENPQYTDVDGVLFSKDKKTLIAYPADKADTTYTIPDGVTSVKEYAFQHCRNMTEVIFSNTMTSTGEYTFVGCQKLKSVTLSSTITTIGSSSFAGCSALTDIVIPDTVTSIGNSAFSECVSLIEIIIPNSVTFIGDAAFSGCDSLIEIIVPNSVTFIGDYAFSRCFNLTSVELSNKIDTIGQCTFWGCFNLTDITIPDSILTIQNEAFSGCMRLNNVVIPNSVTSLGRRAFSGCSNLTSLSIPESVLTILSGAFSGCTNLTSAIIPANAKQIDGAIFPDCPNLTVYGYTGTPAEATAQSSGVRFVSLGSSAEPVFITNISSAEYGIGDNAILSVDVAVADNGTVTYQWYSKSYPEHDGWLIVGATEPSFAVSTMYAGETYYYVIATNTSPSGAKATAQSNIAKITVRRQNSVLTFIQVPESIAIANGTPLPTVSFPTKVTIHTTGSMVTAPVVWDIANCTYDPTNTGAQTVIINGTVTLPAGVTNPNNIPLTTSITVHVRAANSDVHYVFAGVETPAAITNVPNGTPLNEIDLPDTVSIRVIKYNNGTIVGPFETREAPVVWDIANCQYNPTTLYQHTVKISGTVTLPSDVVNSHNIPLTTEIQVQINASDKKHYAGCSYTSVIYDIPNGTELRSSGLPSMVTANVYRYSGAGMVQENIQVPVTWDYASAEKKYDKNNPHMQHVVVIGRVTLPADVVMSPLATATSTTLSVHLWFAASTSHTTGTDQYNTSIDPTVLAAILANTQNKKSQAYYVTASAGNGGNISPAGAVLLAKGQEIVYIVTPNEGYEIKSVLLNGVEMGAVSSLTITGTEAAQNISVTFHRASTPNPFKDISSTDAYYEAALYVCEAGIMKGVTKTQFAPDKTMTRAMFIQTLGKMAEVDTEYFTDNAFCDLDENSDTAAYAQWAAENGIVTGYEDGSFGAKTIITMEQAAVILYRYAKYAGVPTESTLVLTDKTVSPWAIDAMEWAVEQGVCTYENGNLNPKTEATRAMVAEMLYAFANMCNGQ